jgi:Resolvase, N terminal domain/Recombinase zinc beta ribbon domain
MLITNPTFQAIGCIRVSTSEQSKNYGPAVQETDIQTYAREQKIELLYCLQEVQSGFDQIDDRATVQQYLSLARAHPGLNFIFPRVNRIGRRAEYILGIARQLIEECHATVHAVGVYAPRGTRHWWRELGLQAVEVESDYRSTVENLANGKRQKAMQNRWAHGSAPTGYRIVRDERGKSSTLEIIPDEIAWITRAFELGLTNGSRRIQIILEQEGFGTHAITSIKNAFANETYAGIAWYGRNPETRVPILVPAAIPREIFDLVKARQQDRIRQRAPGVIFAPGLLTNFARCHVCGGTMSRETHNRRNKNGTYHNIYYYRCWRANPARTKGKPCEHKKNHKAPIMDDLAWTHLTHALADPARLRSILEPKHSVAPDLTAQIIKLEANLARAWEPFKNGLMPLEVAQALAEPDRLELERIKTLASNPSPNLDTRDYPLLAERLVAGLENLTSVLERREFIQRLGVMFYIVPDGSIARITIGALLN